VQNPNLCPPYLDITAFNTDFANTHNLLTLNNTALQLHESIDDTAITANSEACQTSLVFYNSMKIAARQDVPGAKAVYKHSPVGGISLMKWKRKMAIRQLDLRF
jgi:hypothetical protein